MLWVILRIHYLIEAHRLRKTPNRKKKKVKMETKKNCRNGKGSAKIFRTFKTISQTSSALEDCLKFSFHMSLKKEIRKFILRTRCHTPIQCSANTWTNKKSKGTLYAIVLPVTRLNTFTLQTSRRLKQNRKKLKKKQNKKRSIKNKIKNQRKKKKKYRRYKSR